MGIEDLVRASQTVRTSDGTIQQRQDGQGGQGTGRWNVPSSYEHMKDMYNELATSKGKVGLEQPDIEDEEPQYGTQEATALDKFAYGAGQAADAVMGMAGDYGESWSKGDYGTAAGQFLASLPLSMVAAPLSAVENLYQGLSGRDLDTYDEGTGEISEKELSPSQKVGHMGTGLIDMFGATVGGTREAWKLAGNLGRKAMGKPLKDPFGGMHTREGGTFAGQIASDVAEEAAEEGTQQFFEDMADDQLDEGTLGRMGQAAALGGLGGGIMSGVAGGINRAMAKASGFENVWGTDKDKDAVSQAGTADDGSVITAGVKTHDTSFWTPVSGLYGSADSHIKEYAAEIQNKEYREPGATSSKVLVGDFGVKLDEIRLSSRDLKTMYDSDAKGAQYLLDSLNYGREEAGQQLITMEQFDKVMSMDRLSIADGINEFLKENNARFTVTAERNPKTNFVSDVRLTCDNVVDSGGVFVNPALMPYTNGDYDGDAFVQMFNPEHLNLAKSPLDTFFDSRPVDGGSTSKTAFDWDNSGISLSTEVFKRSKGKDSPMFAAFRDAGVDAVWFKKFKDAVAEKKTDTWKFDALNVLSQIRAEERSGRMPAGTTALLIQKMQENTSRYVAIDLASKYAHDQVDVQNISFRAGALADALAKVVPYDTKNYPLDRKSYRDRLATQMAQINTVAGGCLALCDKTTNPYMRNAQAKTQGSDLATIVNQVERDARNLQGDPVDQFRLMLAHGLQRINMSTEPINQIEGVFRSVVLTRTLIKFPLDPEQRLGSGLTAKDEQNFLDGFMNAFAETYEEYRPIYNEALQTLTYDGLEIDVSYHEKAPLDTETQKYYAFQQIFGNSSITRWIAGLEGTDMYNMTWNGLIETLAKSGNITLFDPVSEKSKVAADLAKTLVESYHKLSAMKGSRVEQLIEDLVSKKNRLNDDGSNNPKLEDNPLGMQVRWEILSKLIGERAFMELGIVNVRSAIASPWGRYMFSNNPSDLKNLVISLGQFGKWRGVVQEVLNKNYDQAFANATALTNLTPLDDFILSEMYRYRDDPSDLRAYDSLLNMCDPTVALDDKVARFDTWAKKSLPKAYTPNIYENALKTRESELGEGEVGEKIRKATAVSNSSVTLNTTKDKMEWKALYESTINDATTRSDLVRAIEYQLENNMAKLNKSWYGACFSEGGALTKDSGQKSKAMETASLMYQQLHMQGNGRPSSVIHKVTGPNSGTLSLDEFVSRTDLMANLLADKDSTVTVYDGGEVSFVNRNSIFALAGVELGNDRPTLPQWDKLFDKFPQLLSLLCDRTYDLMPNSRGTVIETRIQGVEKSIRGTLSQLNDPRAAAAKRTTNKIEQMLMDDVRTPVVITGMIGAKYKNNPIEIERIISSPKRMKEEAVKAFDKYVNYVRMSASKQNEASLLHDRQQQAIMSNIYAPIWRMAVDMKRVKEDTDDIAMLKSRMIQKDYVNLIGAMEIIKDYNADKGTDFEISESDSSAGKMQIEIRPYEFLMDTIMTIAPQNAFMDSETGELYELDAAKVSQHAYDIIAADMRRRNSEVDEASLRAYVDRYIRDHKLGGKAGKSVSNILGDDSIAIPSHVITAAMDLENPDFEPLAAAIKKIYHSPYSSEKGAAEIFDTKEKFEKLKKDNPEKWPMMVKYMADQWNSEVLRYALQPFTTYQNINRNYDFYGITSNAYDVMADAVVTASDNGLWSNFVDPNDIEVPDIDFSNRALAYIAGNLQSAMESAGNTINSGVEGGMFKWYYVWGAAGKDTFCTAEPKTMTVNEAIAAVNKGDLRLGWFNYVDPDDGKDEVVSVDETVFAELSRKAQNDPGFGSKQIQVYPYEDCHWGCRHHTRQSVTGSNWDMLNPLGKMLIDLVYQGSEEHVLKRKKAIGKFLYVLSDLSTNEVSKRIDLTGSTDIHQTLLNGINRYRTEVGDWFFQELANEQLTGYSQTDCYMLAQFLCKRIKLDLGGGENVCVSMSQLSNPDFNLDDILQGRQVMGVQCFSLGIESEMRMVTEKFLRANDLSEKKLDAKGLSLLLKDVLEDDVISISDTPLQNAIAKYIPTRTSFRGISPYVSTAASPAQEFISEAYQTATENIMSTYNGRQQQRIVQVYGSEEAKLIGTLNKRLGFKPDNGSGRIVAATGFTNDDYKSHQHNSDEQDFADVMDMLSSPSMYGKSFDHVLAKDYDTYVYVHRRRGQSISEYEDMVVAQINKYRNSAPGMKLIVDPSVGVSNPIIAMAGADGAGCEMNGKDYMVLDTRNIRDDEYPIMYRSGSHSEDPEALGIMLVGDEYTVETNADSGEKIFMTARQWENLSIPIDDFFTESQSYLPEELKNVAAHIVTYDELNSLDFDKMRETGQIRHLKYPDGRNAPLGKDYAEAQKRTEKMVKDFIENTATNGISVGGYRTSANQDDVIALVRYGNEPTATYIPLIANTTHPVHMDRIVVGINPKNETEPMISYHTELTPNRFLGLKHIFTVFDWKAYAVGGENIGEVEPGYELGFMNSKGETRRADISGAISLETAKTRDANMKQQTLANVLLKGKQLMPCSAFAVKDGNGNWVPNKPSRINLSDAQWIELSDINKDPTRAMREALQDPFGLVDGDLQLSLALSTFFNNCIAHNVHPAYIMSNVFPEYAGVDAATGEKTYVAKSFYQTAPAGAILDGMSQDQLLRFFHLINPNLCPNGIDAMDSVAGAHRTLFDTHGNMLLKNKDGRYYYGRVHIEPLAFKRENTDMGHQSEKGTFGTQMFMNNLIEKGLGSLTEGQIARYIETLQTEYGDLRNFQIGGKFARKMEVDMTAPDFIPLSQRAEIAYHEEQLYAKDYYTELNEDGFQTYNRFRPIVEDLRTGTETNQDKINALYDKVWRELHISGPVKPIQIHKVVNMFYGYSYNGGEGETRITFDDFEKAVNAFITNVKSGNCPIPARSQDNRVSVPVGPKATMDWIYNVMHDGGFTQLDRQGYQEMLEEQMKHAIENVAMVKGIKKRRSLEKILNYGCIQNGMTDLFGHFDYYIPSEEIARTQSDFLRTCGGIDKEAFDNEVANIEASRQIASDYERMYKKAQYSKTPDASSPNGYAYTYLGPQMAGWRKVAKQATNLASAMAICDPIIGAASVAGRPLHSMFTKGLMFLDTIGVPATGGNRGYRVDQRLLHEASKAQEVKTVWNAVNNMQRLGLTNDAIIQGLSKPDEFEEFINAKMKENGIIDKFKNFAFKMSSGGEAFSNMQIENFFNYFAQHADPNQMPRYFRTMPSGMTYMEDMITHHPAEFMAEILSPESPGFMLAQQAKNFALDGDFAQDSCFSIVLDHYFRNHQVAEFMFYNGFCRFPRYAYNFSGWMLQHVLPVSTIAYVGRDWLMRRNMFVDFHFEQVQTVPSLKTAIIRDACYMSVSMLGMVLALLVDPPDDDDLWGNVNEWLVMGNRVDENWYLQDIIGAPLAMACAMRSIELGHPRPDILFNWLGNALYSNPFFKVGDLISSIFDPDDSKWSRMVEEAERMADAKGGKATPQDVFQTGMLTYGLNFAASFITPAFMKSIYQSSLVRPEEVSYKKVQAVDENGEPIEGELMKTDWSDQQIRKLTRNNPGAALIMNVLSGHYIDPDGTTGYLSFEMPPTNYWDSTAMFYLDRYSVTRKNEETGEIEPKSPEECRRIAYEVISLLQTYPVEELIDEGFCLSSETRRYVSSTLWDCIHYADEKFSAWVDVTGLNPKVVGNGNWDEGQRIIRETKDVYYADRNGIIEIYNNLWSKEFSESWQAYHRYNTTYQQDDNGNWYATGFKKSFLPFQLAPGTLDDAQGTMGYEGNWETVSPLTGESAGGRALVPINMDLGEVPPIESFSSDGNGQEFSGAWGDLTNNWNAKMEVYDEMGDDDDDGSSGYPYGSGYRRSGGGGGGGRSYAPNLYSRPGDFNVQSPRNMQTSTRSYNSNYSYLRPNVEKKGSRDAYTRSDI